MGKLEEIPNLTAAERARLASVVPELVELVAVAARRRRLVIIAGARTDEEQREAFRAGRSKLDGVANRSSHQISAAQPLARALDLAPYYPNEPAVSRIPWDIWPVCPASGVPAAIAKRNLENLRRWYAFAGELRGIAAALGIRIRQGFDWDSDAEYSDQSFHDLPHVELLP